MYRYDCVQEFRWLAGCSNTPITNKINHFKSVTIGEFEGKKSIFFQHFSFYKQLQFRAQLS